MAVWEEIREWLAGKKTYLLAGMLILTVVALVIFGLLTPQHALAVALVFTGLFAASFRSTIEQHHEEVLALLIDLADAGVAVRTHDKVKAEAALAAAAQEGVAIAGEVK